MPIPNRANLAYDVGVPRDPNADIDVDIVIAGGITDIGVPVSARNASNLRDGPSRPNSKKRSDMDTGVPYNPKTGSTNVYQR